MRETRPTPTAARGTNSPHVSRVDRHLLQFAVGWNLAPPVATVTRFTARFRGAALRELLRLKTGDSSTTWTCLSRAAREEMAEMFGKDADGKRLEGHRHAEFLAWCEDDLVTRLFVWRCEVPFNEHEHTAILRAATREISWAPDGSAANAWKARLVPLDRAVPPPPGFDGVSANCWESVTPYVLPRHHLRGAKERLAESLIAQVRRELSQRT